jgi:hypothetical protein
MACTMRCSQRSSSSAPAGKLKQAQDVHQGLMQSAVTLMVTQSLQASRTNFGPFLELHNNSNTERWSQSLQGVNNLQRTWVGWWRGWQASRHDPVSVTQPGIVCLAAFHTETRKHVLQAHLGKVVV